MSSSRPNPKDALVKLSKPVAILLVSSIIFVSSLIPFSLWYLDYDTRCNRNTTRMYVAIEDGDESLLRDILDHAHYPGDFRAEDGPFPLFQALRLLKQHPNDKSRKRIVQLLVETGIRE